MTTVTRSWAFVVYSEVSLVVRTPGVLSLDKVDPFQATLQSSFAVGPAGTVIPLKPGAYGVVLTAAAPVLDYLLTPVDPQGTSVLIVTRNGKDPWPLPPPAPVKSLQLAGDQWALVWRTTKTVDPAKPTADELKMFLFR